MAKIRMKLEKIKSCDQCSATAINGVFCHERGCPNENKRWSVDEWRKTYACDFCGHEVFEDESCCQEGVL